MILQLKNVSLLFVAQLVSYLIPILEIPILARALGVDEYGHILLIQTSALLCSLVVEYGYSLSGSRQVALCAGEKSLLSKIYNEITSAKIILTTGMVVLSFVVLSVTKVDIKLQAALWGYLYFFAFGFSSIWLFQGLEKITFPVVFEVCLRFVGLLMLFMFISQPEDASKALMIMSSFSVLNTVVGFYLVYRVVGGFSFTIRGGIKQIKDGFHSFLYKSSNNIMMSAGPALVGAMCGQAAVAKFAPAEKIIKASIGLVGPVLIGLYPYLSRKLSQSTPLNLKFSAFIVTGLFFAGVVGGGLIFVLGDYLISLMLGPGFEEAIVILRIFVFVIPFRMMNQAMGLTIFMPLGKDRILSFLLIFFSFFSLLLAALLSYEFDLKGVVYGLVLSEIIFSASLVAFAINIKRVENNAC
ncbi:oligosaccharide flippase family protein [Pseudomonas sp. CCC3.1]|uniref:oligosaccharide flippase family protein n=1 Tax=Pseudomonas sp. CCC3.1 TaxID=3048607 RepID=UPI002AC911AA|nr:oligosaccharide flippase family protein [Pseudomonas sp. CCC3.1]MEB0203936.1 oligosaccharide flippase family protein [Pseudomonas sp. CCC3.1]WPX37765.1 oligosaccharide flippase family protein [Pseudomonas sp. CCC3.1]